MGGFGIPASQIERVCRGNTLVFEERKGTNDQGIQERERGLGQVGFQAGGRGGSKTLWAGEPINGTSSSARHAPRVELGDAG